MTKAETIMNKLSASSPEAKQQYLNEIAKMRIHNKPDVTDRVRDLENMDNHVYAKAKP